MQLRKKPEKIHNFNGISARDLAKPVRCSNQLSYETTDVRSWLIMCSYVPVKEMTVIDLYNNNYNNNKKKKLRTKNNKLIQSYEQAN